MTSASHVIRFVLPIALPTKPMSLIPGSVTSGTRETLSGVPRSPYGATNTETGDVVRRAVVAVAVDEQVAGDPECEQVDRHAADDLVGAQRDREHRMDEREEATGDHRDDQADGPRATEIRPEDPEVRAHEHHALDADVHDAAALGDQAAERAPEQRRGEPQHRRDQRRPRDDVLEVAGARLGRGERAGAADQAGRDRAPAAAAIAARDRD